MNYNVPCRLCTAKKLAKQARQECEDAMKTLIAWDEADVLI